MSLVLIVIVSYWEWMQGQFTKGISFKIVHHILVVGLPMMCTRTPTPTRPGSVHFLLSRVSYNHIVNSIADETSED